MNLERTFMVARPEEIVKDRARNFLSAAGYQAVSSSPVKYKRGTLFGSLASISPKKWQAQASVEVTPSGGNQSMVALKIDVNTRGHIITQKEVAYWRTEVEGFERAVSAGEVNPDGLDEAVGAVTKSVWKGFLVFVLVALAVGVPIGLLMSRINRSFSSVGMVIGICAGLLAARKHWGY